MDMPSLDGDPLKDFSSEELENWLLCVPGLQQTCITLICNLLKLSGAGFMALTDDDIKSFPNADVPMYQGHILRSLLKELRERTVPTGTTEAKASEMAGADMQEQPEIAPGNPANGNDMDLDQDLIMMPAPKSSESANVTYTDPIIQDLHDK